MLKQRADKKNTSQKSGKQKENTVPPEESNPDHPSLNTATSLGDVYLFVSLARALKIPSRIIAGAVFNGQPGNEFVDLKLQIWPEYFSENAWHIVDVSQLSKPDSTADFIALRVLDSITQPPNASVDSYLFDTYSVNVVPGSVKMRFRTASIKK